VFLWHRRLDKTKFFVGGAGLFSGVTAALYPLSVIKTRQMVIPGMSPGLAGVRQTFLHVLEHDGVRGLYRGFGTTIVGSVPIRVVYLTVLERVKSGAEKVTLTTHMGEVQRAAVANFAAGACASICSQAVTVPLDVVSQRLQASEHSGGPRYSNGLQAVRMIIAREGLAGLYRGVGASLATYLPASAIWWSAYGAYQRIMWQILNDYAPHIAAVPTTGLTVTVQTGSAICAGLTSGTLTNPLDVIKTRIQVAHTSHTGEHLTFSQVFKQLLKEDGPMGLMRGVAPKIANTALWSTCMVSVYELLKRMCRKVDVEVVRAP